MALVDLANPTRFLGYSGRTLPLLWGVTGLLLAVGLYLSFFVAPPDVADPALSPDVRRPL